MAAAALTVPCPRCTAGVDESCFVQSSGVERAPHADRQREADRRAEAARLQAEGDAEHRIEGRRWRRVFAAARLELEQRAGWTPLAAEQLESVVLNMEAAELARGKAKTSPTVEGSMGQPVANPVIAVALRYDAQALATARALKLTPDTRGSSAPPADGDDQAGDVDGEDDGPRDDLAELDELAKRRKTAPAKRRAKAKGRRKGG